MTSLIKGPFPQSVELLRRQLMEAESLDVGEWQSTDISGNPDLVTRELQNVILETEIPDSINSLARLVEPNLPWAEDHFQERVSTLPLNPGVQYKNWPYYKGNVERHQTQHEEKFSHTYMERFWPKFANEGETRPNRRQVFVPHQGIRFAYGDLLDVVELLQRSPLTRQAYFPIWFPEDTGAHHGERVPCTLGYHFMIRPGENAYKRDIKYLHMTYHIRSCDFLRHFPDDVYMAGRLMQWMTRMLEGYVKVRPGKLIMHMGSLHIFEGDMPKMRGEIG